MGPPDAWSGFRTAVRGDDVTAWGLLDPERTPEAEAPLPVAADLWLRLARPAPLAADADNSRGPSAGFLRFAGHWTDI